jgi:hypothetical protein
MVRFKQRYLLVQVLVEKGAGEPTSRDLYSAITGRVSALLGIWGFGVCKVGEVRMCAAGMRDFFFFFFFFFVFCFCFCLVSSL